MLFDVFSTLFMNAWSSLKLFGMVVLLDVWPLYAHTVLSNEIVLIWLNFYLKSVKVSIFAQYMILQMQAQVWIIKFPPMSRLINATILQLWLGRLVHNMRFWFL